MANRNVKNIGNAEGKFYVDSSCIDCDLCRETAPQIFRRDDEVGVTVAYHQPQSDDELAAATEAMNDCPTNSIGNDG